MMTKIQRRSVLRVLGLAAGSNVLPSLCPSRAEAAPPPKRLFWVFSLAGTLPQFWSPKTGNDTDFVLGDLMTPFEAHKKDLLLLDGLNAKDRDLPGHQYIGNGHQQAYNSILGAIGTTNASFPGGPTIDQLVAKANAGKTKFASIETGINFSEGRYRGDVPSYATVAHPAAGQKLPVEADPRKLWTRVFAGFKPPGATPAPVVDNTNKRQKSILDFVRGELGAASSKLSAADKMKLDAHATGIRELEMRLNFNGGSDGAAVGAGCSAIAQPMAGTSFAAQTDLVARMSAMMLACDLTRVVTMPVLPPENPGSSPYSGGAFGTTDFHDLVHKTSPLNGQLRTNAGAVDMCKAFHMQSSGAMKKILDVMAAMPDADGKRLLDNSLVFWNNELAEGGHTTNNLKWLVAGGSNLGVRTGRWLKCNGAPHSNAYVSIGRALGLDINSFGDPRSCTGPLNGFAA